MNFYDVIDIKVPVNGEIKQVERIKDLTPSNVSTYNLVIWEIPRCKAIFRDNIPVTLHYDIGIDDATTTKKAKTLYLDKIGNVYSFNNIITNFSTYDYVKSPITIDWTLDNSFEFTFKFTTSSNIRSTQNIFSVEDTKICVEICNCRIYWKLSNKYSKVTLNASTDYWLKFIKTKNEIEILLSTDGITFNTILNDKCNVTVKDNYLYFGITKYKKYGTYCFLGEFDLSLWKIKYNTSDSDVLHYNVKILDAEYIDLKQVGNLTTCSGLVYTGTGKKHIEETVYTAYVDYDVSIYTYLRVSINCCGWSSPRYVKLKRNNGDKITLAEMRKKGDGLNNYKVSLKTGDSIIVSGACTANHGTEWRIQRNNSQDISNFSATCYVKTPIFINWKKNNNFAVMLKITTSPMNNTCQGLFTMLNINSKNTKTNIRYTLNIQRNKLYWLYNELYSDYEVFKNEIKTYYIKFEKIETKVIIKLYDENMNLLKLMKDGNDMIGTADDELINNYMVFGAYSTAYLCGVLHCDGSYLIYNNNKLKFRI